MRILGVDPGLNATGYGLIEIGLKSSVTALEAGTIEPKASLPFEMRLLKVYQHIDQIVERQKPSVLVLEKLYSHTVHPVTVAVMGHVRGVICLVCARRGIELIEESPKRVRKSVVGNGNASKEQTRNVVARLLNIQPESMTLDASDALALAFAYANMKKYR